MSKAITTALKAHLAQGSTTLALLWKATRRDGFILAVTTCARDILFNGTLYQSKSGFTPKAEAQEASAAVANTEAEGALSDQITEADFQAGLWDGCTVELLEVNYRDLSMGAMSHGIRTMGNIKVSRSAFNAELRGLAQGLQVAVGSFFTGSCTATLGDARCKVSLAPFTVTGSVTSVTDLARFSDTSRKEAPDWFKYGVITWTSGANVGLSMEVGAFAAGAFQLALPMPYNVAVGDAYTAVAGCNKTLKGNMARTGAVSFGATGVIVYDGTRIEPVGFYAGGSMRWTSGANNGVAYNITNNIAGQLVLATTPSNPMVVGDSYVISPPASVLRNGDCVAKFNNVINFRGFPDLPGADLVLGLGGTGGTSL